MVSSSTAAKRKATYGFSFTADDAANDNQTTLDGCTIPKEANYSVYLQQGGKFVAKNNNIDSAFAYFVSTAGSRSFDASVIDNNLAANVRGYANIGASVNTGNKFLHKNTFVEESKNIIWTVSNLNFLGTVGHRTLEGSAPSNTANNSSASFQGDEWRIDTPAAASPYSWVSTANVITAQLGTWVELNALP